MISLVRILKDYREAGALNALINLHAAIDPHTFLTKSGDVMTVLAVQGVDYECLDPEQRDELARRFESALRGFDERFRIYQYLIKGDQVALPSRAYENPVVKEATENRANYLRARASRLYSLETYFVVVLEKDRQADSMAQRLRRLLTHPKEVGYGLSSEKTASQLHQDLEHSREILAGKVMTFTVQMREFLPVEILEVEPAFAFLRRLLNYTPHVAEAAKLKYFDFVDFQACDSALECHRDHLRLDDYFVQVLTLKEPPAKTFAHLLSGLEEIPSNAIVASEWKRASSARARQIIQSKRRHFYNSKASLMNYVGSGQSSGPKDMLIDDSAVAVVTELGACLQDIEVNNRYVGEFSMTVVLYDKDQKAVPLPKV